MALRRKEKALSAIKKFKIVKKGQPYRCLPEHKTFVWLCFNWPIPCAHGTFWKNKDGKWLLTEYFGTSPSPSLELSHLNLEIPLKEIYERVEFTKKRLIGFDSRFFFFVYSNRSGLVSEHFVLLKTPGIGETNTRFIIYKLFADRYIEKLNHIA